jgi:transposase
MAHSEILVQQLAARLGLARNTIWCLCRRYEEVGAEAVFDAARSGRPWLISPLAARQP